VSSESFGQSQVSPPSQLSGYDGSQAMET